MLGGAPLAAWLGHAFSPIVPYVFAAAASLVVLAASVRSLAVIDRDPEPAALEEAEAVTAGDAS